MISIIICSRKVDIPESLRQNVESTIGCDFEWIIVDNSNNQYNIFQAYNEGVARSTGDILCFMHDDILFLTDGWGGKVQRHLEMGVGLIGVIGNHLLPDHPASWWTTSLRSGHVVQRSHVDNRNTDIIFDKYRQPSLNYSEVVTVDGLWFCMPKNLFSRIRFDEDTFHGFHCYDTDICMQVLQLGMSVRTVFDIPIAHYSIGPLNKTFFQERKLWYEKWKEQLPIWRGVELTSNEIAIFNEMSTLVNELLEEKVIAEDDARQLRASYAYRLGKRILKPIKWIKRR